MKTVVALIAAGLVAGCRPPPAPPPPPEVKRFEDVAQELGRPELAMHQLYRKTDPNHKPRIMMEPCNRLGAHDGRKAYGWFNGWGRLGCASLERDHIIIDWGDGTLLTYPLVEFATCGENDENLCRF